MYVLSGLVLGPHPKLKPNPDSIRNDLNAGSELQKASFLLWPRHAHGEIWTNVVGFCSFKSNECK
jgi:hypothetical protein